MSSKISTTVHIVKYANPVLLPFNVFIWYLYVYCLWETDLLGYNKTREKLILSKHYPNRPTNSAADPNQICCPSMTEQFLFLCCVYSVKS